MKEPNGCLHTIVGIFVIGILAMLVGLSIKYGVGAVIAVLIGMVVGLFAIASLWGNAKKQRARRKFLQEAPSQIQNRMATVREGLIAGASHLETAEGELESATAPLFWDAMDDFVPAMGHCTAVWNGAVDLAEQYEKLSADSPRSDEDGVIAPDSSLPKAIAEMGEKWEKLRRQALGNQHFASIFEQRRQADKIADRLKKQGEEIRTAIDAARRAEVAASQAVAVAGKAMTTSKQAAAKARGAGAAAQRAGAAAQRAGSTARSASTDATEAVSIARWSKI